MTDKAALGVVSAICADEAALVARLRAGDDDAFADVVRTFGGRMLAVTRRMLRNEEDARDAVQDAFASVARSVATFDHSCRLATWLHRIVVNAALMKIRRRRRKPEDSIDELMPRFYADGHRIDPGPAWDDSLVEKAMVSADSRELVRRAIDRLPESYRTVIVLRDIEDLDTEETARLLEITPSAVKVRLHRARQALRTLLDPHFRERR